MWHIMAGKRVYEFVAAAQGFSAILWQLGSPSLGFPNGKLFRRAGFQLLSLHLQNSIPHESVLARIVQCGAVADSYCLQLPSSSRAWSLIRVLRFFPKAAHFWEVVCSACHTI